ncbi:hypothetical protein N657DRAFT_73853 [Parathielavia appendiculata]|uniref:Uncharacterized protein n=1 Tax=Parathielavia appendiculata TaxID=2587402 RepID=A0AAN6UAW8_9PEZI|nr:hypothetical protein N657DRAFT_73853 [Parathielavia appendiculata]
MKGMGITNKAGIELGFSLIALCLNILALSTWLGLARSGTPQARAASSTATLGPVRASGCQDADMQQRLKAS